MLLMEYEQGFGFAPELRKEQYLLKIKIKIHIVVETISVSTH
mgnify:CR=1 FL=1